MLIELSFLAAAMIIGLLIGVLVKLHRILALLNERPTLPEWRSTGAFGMPVNGAQKPVQGRSGVLASPAAGRAFWRS